MNRLRLAKSGDFWDIENDTVVDILAYFYKNYDIFLRELEYNVYGEDQDVAAETMIAICQELLKELKDYV